MAGVIIVYDPAEPAKYINDTVEFRPGQVMKATDINRWLNMLIQQGDFNTAWLEHIMEQLNAAKVREIALTERVTELEAELASAQDNIAILCALHGRQPA